MVVLTVMVAMMVSLEMVTGIMTLNLAAYFHLGLFHLRGLDFFRLIHKVLLTLMSKVGMLPLDDLLLEWHLLRHIW